MAVLADDAMFLAASALGALYVLQLPTWGVNAIQGAAIVSLYSAPIVVPWYLWSAPAPMWRVALNHAISRLGAERSSAMVAARRAAMLAARLPAARR